MTGKGACAECARLVDDLAFAQECIVELQHIVRELRHEVASLKSPLAEAARRMAA